jgi:hypothetical protein
MVGVARFRALPPGPPPRAGQHEAPEPDGRREAVQVRIPERSHVRVPRHDAVGLEAEDAPRVVESGPVQSAGNSSSTAEVTCSVEAVPPTSAVRVAGSRRDTSMAAISRAAGSPAPRRSSMSTTDHSMPTGLASPLRDAGAFVAGYERAGPIRGWELPLLPVAALARLTLRPLITNRRAARTSTA